MSSSIAPTSTTPNAQSPITTDTTSTTAVTNGTLGKDDFMKLLVAQLAHQDPTSPSDPSQFVSQLSQFSSLEELTNIKSGLDLLAVTQTAGTSAQMVSFIGKDVAFDGSSVVWKPGQAPVPTQYTVAANADDVSVRIADAQGNTVKTVDLHAEGSGDHTFTFDGTKQDGSPLPAGTYTVEVSAKDAQGKAISVESRSTGHVTAVTFENGYPELVLADGRTLGLGQVLEVLTGTTDPTDPSAASPLSGTSTQMPVTPPVSAPVNPPQPTETP